MPSYNNSVKSEDPRVQVRVFNGKPQFRIRKRQESAKGPGFGSRIKTRKNITEMTQEDSNTANDYPQTGYKAYSK